MDPRTKLFLVAVYTIIVVLEKQLSVLAVALVLAFSMIWLRKLTRQWLRTLKMTGPMLAIALLISLVSFGPQITLQVGMRLLCVVSAFFIFFQTTLPEDLAGALVKMGVPYVFAFILTTAMEFVPVIQRKVRNVIDAQRSRGIPVEFSLRGLRYYPALLVPIMVSSFSLADELAMAMESRGFGRPGRTFYREYAFKWVDYLAIGMGLAILLVLSAR
ncbi:MAG TPA: energy-coupling factor transporter transmembrane protein EcfT [Chloroflexi bacterium]|nr:energy-coupling factor transporter transmembrane protein EcfT [Chloroflexota bacterium]